MSRAYKIRVSESLVHHRRVEDGVEARLEVLPILDRARSGELLLEELEGRGWEIEGSVATKAVGKATVTINTENGTVTIRGVVEEDVEMTIEREGRAYDENAVTARANLAERARKDLEQQAAAEDERIGDALAEELERVLAEVKPELDAVTDAVNRGALKERARQLGEVVEVHEDANSGEMTIRVKV